MATNLADAIPITNLKFYNEIVVRNYVGIPIFLSCLFFPSVTAKLSRVANQVSTNINFTSRRP